MTSTFTPAALRIAAKGMPCFPCGPDKRPLTAHGFKDASTDPAQIEAWGREHPAANIGLPTGSTTGRVVVDLDLDPEKGKDGLAELAKLETIHGPLPDTLTIRTPRGGLHLHFRLPEGASIRSRTDHPAPGIDIRAEGGYVIIPPSRTERGAYTLDRKAPLADLPPWFLSLLTEQPRPAHAPRPAPVVDAYSDTPEERIRSALRVLSPNMGNAEWVQVGMALHSWHPERGLALWEEWSVPGQTYQPGETARRWKSFDAAPGGVGLGTLFHQAKGAGWTPTPAPRPALGTRSAARLTAGGQHTAEEEEQAAPALPAPVDAAAWLAEEPAPVVQIVADVIDAGCKVGIVAPSKSRKSFFALQLALAVATGRRFLAWEIPAPRRVLLVQLEIPAGHFHRRVKRMAEAMGATAADLGDRLKILNWRGWAPDAYAGRLADLEAVALELRPEMIILDPLYKVLPGDENSAHETRPVLAAFDRMAETTRAALAYVHHTAKGQAGDRAAVDRAVGSGIIARDFDAQFSLVPHRDHDEAAPLFVVEVTARSYPPARPISVSFDGATFSEVSTAPVVRTSATAPRNGGRKMGDEEIVQAAREWGPLPAMTFVANLRDLLGSRDAAKERKADLVCRGLLTRTRQPGQNGAWMISAGDDCRGNQPDPTSGEPGRLTAKTSGNRKNTSPPPPPGETTDGTRALIGPPSTVNRSPTTDGRRLTDDCREPSIVGRVTTDGNDCRTTDGTRQPSIVPQPVPVEGVL